MNKKNTLSVDEAIDEFYKLKDNYEQDYYEKYLKPIIKKKQLSNKEKRVAFSKLPKAKCINCNRNVGALFNIKLVSHINRVFTAKCGDLAQPCPLDINISVGTKGLFSNYISMNENDINKIKYSLVKEKNNVLFGYTNVETATKMFKQLTEELVDITNINGYIIEQNILTNDNPAKIDLLKKTQEDFLVELIMPLKSMISQYKESENVQFMRDAVELYVNGILPKIEEIKLLKYDVNMMEQNSDTLLYTLRQEKHSLTNLEFSLNPEQKIVNFTTGVLKPTNLNKTLKTSKKTHKETVPVRLVITDDSPILSIEQTDTDLTAYNEPTIDGSFVSWSNKKYQNVWNKLDIKYKTALLLDKYWLKKTMINLVQNYETNSPFIFVSPDNLIIPPKLLENGTYDFGNSTYTEIINGMDKNQRNVIFTMLPKNESESPKAFLNAISHVIKQMLRIQTYY